MISFPPPLIHSIPLFNYYFSSTSSGFKSRVKFFSVLDPTSIVTYTSEVLDGGLLGPLFQVSHLLRFKDFMFEDYFHSSFVFLEMSEVAFPPFAFPVSCCSGVTQNFTCTELFKHARNYSLPVKILRFVQQNLYFSLFNNNLER